VYLFLVGFRIIFRLDVFFSDLGDGWNFGRYPRKFLSPKKERVRVRVVSKRTNSTGRQRYIHLHPPNVSLQSRVAVRVVRKPARIREHSQMRICFFLSPAFCLKVWFLPQKIRKMKEILLLRRKGKRNCLLLLNNNTRETVGFFFQTNTSFSLSLSLSVCVCHSSMQEAATNRRRRRRRDHALQLRPGQRRNHGPHAPKRRPERRGAKVCPTVRSGRKTGCLRREGRVRGYHDF